MTPMEHVRREVDGRRGGAMSGARPRKDRLTTADLIEQLQALDPGGSREVFIDEDGFRPLRSRDLGWSGVDGRSVVVIQYEDWPEVHDA